MQQHHLVALAQHAIEQFVLGRLSVQYRVQEDNQEEALHNPFGPFLLQLQVVAHAAKPYQQIARSPRVLDF
jgi:hypothetical protein